MRRLLALVTVAAAGALASAQDCIVLDPLTRALVDCRDAVEVAQSAAGSGGDVAGGLAGAHGALDDGRTVLRGVKGLGPARRKVASARRFVVHAEKKPSDAVLATKLLGRADGAVAKAMAILDKKLGAAGCGVEVGMSLTSVQVFPTDNWWNEDISGRDVAANSAAVIDFIGRGTPLHADFGTDFGIPYVVIERPQPLVELAFGYDDESDHGAPGHPLGYPIPRAARNVAGFVEGGVPGGGNSGDRHLLLVDRTSGFLYELFATRWDGTTWHAGSGAIFDLTSNARRPEGWTSADAAGLAIFPGLVRADEVYEAGEIKHAIRFTARATQGYVYPASHDATHGSGGDLRPPLGLRVRLKDIDISGFSAPVRVILTAMKKYGLILADNGSDWYLTGAPDPRWDDETNHDEFLQVTGDDFEVVQ